jgi:hypothetical protein
LDAVYDIACRPPHSALIEEMPKYSTFASLFKKTWLVRTQARESENVGSYDFLFQFPV